MDAADAVARAIHDAHLTFDLGAIIAGRRVVGVMGGHQLPRDSDRLRPGGGARLRPRAARHARVLGRWSRCDGGGASGGGLSRQATTVRSGIDLALAGVPRMPDLHGILNPDGTADPALVEPRVSGSLPRGRRAQTITEPVESLSIPTWHYGHEPTSPFATRIAKLFQNSVREDGLITIARQGLVFTRGSAGTLQEVFQDAQQNFYAQHPDFFSPMVFLDREYWTRCCRSAPCSTRCSPPRHPPCVRRPNG